MREHGSLLLYVHGNRKVRQDGQFRTATSTFTQLLNYVTSTETVRTTRDGEPKTATSTSTQLLSSAQTGRSVQLYQAKAQDRSGQSSALSRRGSNSSPLG